MTTPWSRALLWPLLVLAVVVAALLAAAWATLPLERTALTLDGETFALADLQGVRAVLFFVLAVALVMIAVVAVLAVAVVALGLAAVGIALGLIVPLASLALVAAPFVLVAWLLWRLVRTRPVAAVAARP